MTMLNFPTTADTSSDTTSSPATSPPNHVTSSGNNPNNEDGCTVECSSGFYCTADNKCNPDCGSWEQDSHHLVVATDAVVIVSTCIGVVAGVAVLIVTGLRRKQM